MPTKKYTIIGILFFILFLTLLLLADAYVSIQTIKVVSEKQDKSLTALEVLKKRNLLFLNIEEVEQILYQANPDLKAVSLEKKYPNGIEITAVFDEPAAILSVARGFFVLSNTGRILYKLNENKTQLPVINYYQKLNYVQYSAGEEIEYKDIKAALNFLKKTQELAMQVNTIDIKGLDMIALNLNKKRIFFTTEKKVSAQEYELEVVVRQLKIQGKEFEVLDLRFEKPVVKF